MKSEFEIREDVITYLESLGYGKETISREVLINTNKRVDLVVKSQDSNLIAIEINSNPIVFNSVSDIGFSPIARQLQKSAQELGADYYIISNGTRHLWLETNDIGRPTEIEPISREGFGKIKLSNSEYYYALLDHVSAFLQNFPITGDLSYDFSFVLYRKILNDLNISFDQDISETHFESKISEQKIKRVLERWESLNFIENESILLNYIDDYLLKAKNEWHLPRWLANFMISLYPEDEIKNEFLDIYSKYGTLVSSAHLNHWNNVESFYSNENNEFWIKSQQVLTSKKLSQTVYTPDLLKHNIFGIVNDKFDCVLVAPPFGFKVLKHFGVEEIDSIELMIFKAIERCKKNGFIIALVPDSVLLSSYFKKLRHRLFENYSLEGIINLTPKTFKPFTAVSTSVIIIKKSQTKNQRTFLASLDDIPKSNDISNNSILRKWRAFLNDDTFEQERDGFISKDLETSNFHFSNYFYRNPNLSHENLSSGFQVIPLKELVYFIKRGSSYKKDKNEEVPYLAPAAVRTMKLLEEGLSYTSFDKVPKTLIKSEINDIIINIIGTQKGSAAIITDTFKGLGINQHLVLLRANLDLVQPLYLALALNSDYVQKQFEDGSTGSVIPSLNLKSFESIYIPIPPFGVQDKICRNYTEQINKITISEKSLNKDKQELKKMFLNLGKEGDLL